MTILPTSLTGQQSFLLGSRPLIPQALIPLIGNSYAQVEEAGKNLKETALTSVKLDQVINALKEIGLEDGEINSLKAEYNGQAVALVDDCFDRILSGQIEVDFETVNKECFISLRNSEGNTLLGAAAAKGDADHTRLIAQVFKDTHLVHAKDPYGRTAMHIAVMYGHTHLVPILDQLLSLKDKDKGGFTPLHWAIQSGNNDTLTTVMNKGVSLREGWKNPYTNQVFSPIAMAVIVGNTLALTTLIEKDALRQTDLTQPIAGVGNILHLAITYNQSDMLEHLVQNYQQQVKTLLDQLDIENRTPLQLAAFLGDLYAIRYLYQQYIRINEGDLEAGGTAVHYAVKGAHPEAIQLLDYLGASLTEPDEEGRSPLGLLSGRDNLKPEEIRCKNLLENLPRRNRMEKTAPPTFIRRPPLNLVFQGGGPKGFAYLGVLKALQSSAFLEGLRLQAGESSMSGSEPQNLMVEVRRVAGTSAGAITAALLAVGYDANSLEEPLNKDFIELLDFKGDLEKNLFEAVNHGSKKDAIKAILGAYRKNLNSIHFINAGKKLLEQLLDTKGLCDGSELLDWAEKLIKEKTKKSYLTFGELATLVRRAPTKYKHLHIFALNVKPGQTPEVVRFSSEDDKWKELIIADAIRASVSIPGVFMPYYLRFKNAAGLPNEDKSYGAFIDGGLVQNLPIEAFDDMKYQEDVLFKGHQTNRRTLGFSLVEAKDLRQVEQIEGDINSAKALIKAVINTYFEAEAIIRKSQDTAQGRVVPITIEGVTLLDFKLTEEQKFSMVESGKKAVAAFLGFKESLNNSSV